jgi:hypothetical protein
MRGVFCRLKEGGRPRVRRVHVPPEDNDRDATRTGQLQGRGGRLNAATGDPRVVDNQDIGTGDRIANAHPAWVNAPGVDRPWHDGQPHQGQGDARPDQAGKRMVTRAALPARHHRDGRRPAAHPRGRPDRAAAAGQERAKHLAEPRPGRRDLRRRDAIRLVPAQVGGERPATHRVPDRRDSVREQPAGLAQRQVTLVTPGKASSNRSPASSADHTPMLGPPADIQ